MLIEVNDSVRRLAGGLRQKEASHLSSQKRRER